MRKYIYSISLSLLVVFIAAAGYAQIPQTINYQGSLKNAADSTPVTDPVEMTFTLYDSPTGGENLWTQTTSNVNVVNGIYSVILDISTASPALAFDKPYYLEVAVEGTTLSPRQQLTAVPYALNAASVKGIKVNDTGNVGINTEPGVGKLRVRPFIYIVGKTTVGNPGLSESGLMFTRTDEDGALHNWYWLHSPQYNNAQKNGLFLYEKQGSGNYTPRFFIKSGGQVGIKKFPSYELDVSGTIRGDTVSDSDARLKEDVQPLTDALDKVSQLQGVSFQWKDTTRGEGRHIGVIAQDVEPVFPEVVSTDSDGYKSVAYDKLVAPLIEAVKTLKAENDALRTENSALRAKDDELEQRIMALEQTLNKK